MSRGRGERQLSEQRLVKTCPTLQSRCCLHFTVCWFHTQPHTSATADLLQHFYHSCRQQLFIPGTVASPDGICLLLRFLQTGYKFLGACLNFADGQNIWQKRRRQKRNCPDARSQGCDLSARSGLFLFFGSGRCWTLRSTAQSYGKHTHTMFAFIQLKALSDEVRYQLSWKKPIVPRRRDLTQTLTHPWMMPLYRTIESFTDDALFSSTKKM